MAYTLEPPLSPDAEDALTAASKAHAAELARLEEAIQAAHAAYGDVIRRVYTGGPGQKMAIVRLLGLSLSQLDRILRSAVYARRAGKSPDSSGRVR